MTCPTCNSELYSNGVCPNCDTVEIPKKGETYAFGHIPDTGEPVTVDMIDWTPITRSVSVKTVEQACEPPNNWIVSVSYAMAGAIE